eukprot:CAMPEP_0115023262 /NCGR_PEP_ID=MMETSP0216-20121206/32253_1 /TAXON_ID=223996 /ORGANISM="Protocruzia adherens, Strain Boccale" /LENGTH=331 /DNA_ID=CAMNT_0002396527 /DNA_START=40 /DNA_END=1035 /DNA_ORIENTATION=-
MSSREYYRLTPKSKIQKASYRKTNYGTDTSDGQTSDGERLVSKKRKDRRKLTRLTDVDESQPVKRVAAYCKCEDFDMEELEKASNHLFGDVETVKHFGEVVYIERNDGIIFCFPFGVIVLWAYQEVFELDCLDRMKPFMLQETSEVESDDLNYLVGEVPGIRNDKIIIESVDPIEKLAVSYALAQSIKLGKYEEEVETMIDKTKEIPINLAETGNISLNKSMISKKMGELFVKRSYVNLHTDILDTPDCFWDQDEWESSYTMTRKYLDINKRVEILNSRLDIIKELYDMLNTELQNQHGSKLEWIVIYLIIIEVVIEVVWNIIIKDILKLV